MGRKGLADKRLNREWLHQKYIEEGLSTLKIAEIVGCSSTTIGEYLHKFNIPVRSCNDYESLNLDREWLYQKYIEEGLSTLKIAEIVGCSSTTIGEYLHKFNIPVRSCNDYESTNALDLDRKWLYQKYVEEGLSTYKIAEIAGCGRSSINTYLHKFNIPVRDNAGKNNHNYIDISPEKRRKHRGWMESAVFRKKVLKRDRYRCQRCGTGKKKAKQLHVHHIKPWGQCPELRFDPDNGLTLCQACHLWVHSNANIYDKYLDLDGETGRVETGYWQGLPLFEGAGMEAR